MAAQLDLQRCYYNFLRPHLALKFGTEFWTPSMMAGIAKHKLTWRDILDYLIFVAIVMLLKMRQVHKGWAQAVA